MFVGEKFHRKKLSSPSQNLAAFPQRSFIRFIRSFNLYFTVLLNICLILLINYFKLLTDIQEGVHLTLPLHIFSIQVKSRSMLHHGSVGESLKQNKRNLTLALTLNLLLPSIVFHNKICVKIRIFTALSFLRLIHALPLI